MALVMIQIKSALDAWWKPALIFSGGMLGLFLLGVMSRASRISISLDEGPAFLKRVELIIAFLNLL